MREPLEILRTEVPRLLAAGAGAARDEGLGQPARVLRRLGRQVPALNRLADAVDQVTQAPVSQAPAALLNLLGLTRQAAAVLATAGVSGTLEPLPPGGPW